MRFRYAAYLGASMIAYTAPAFAQDAAVPDTATDAENVVEDDGTAGEVIIVEARRRDEDIQDVPLTVNAVTAEQIQKLNLRDLTEIQTVVPGLQLRNEANGVGGSAQVRGVQFDINTSSRPSVAFYFNDAPIEASLVLQTMYDIGQIEVQRGPQGTLRGISAPSGSIVVTAKKPDLEEIGGNVSMTGNDIGTLNFNGGFGIPIIKGIAAIRVAGAWEENEVNRVRTIDNVDRRDPFSRSRSGRVSVVVEPVDFLHLEATYQRLDKKFRSFDQYESFSLVDPTAPASNPVLRVGDRALIQETPRLVDQTFNIYNWRAHARFAGQRLIYQGQKFDLDVVSRNNQDSANLVNGSDFYQNLRTTSDNWSHEVRLQNDDRVFDMFDYVLGYFYQSGKPNTRLLLDTPILLPVAFGGGLAALSTSTITSVPDGKATENSYFGNVTAHIGEATEISGGLRYIDAFNPSSVLTLPNGAFPRPARSDDGWIYTASIKHNFTPDLMVYALTGSSRRAGPTITGNFSAMKSPLELAFEAPESETSKSYEVGVKSSFLDNRVRFNLTAFHQTFKNFLYRPQVGTFFLNFTPAAGGGAPVPSVSTTNFTAAVPVKVNGAEAELSVDITRNWNLNILAAYALGKIKKGTIACTDLNQDGIPDLNPAVPTVAAFTAIPGIATNHFSTCSVNQRSSAQSPFTATVQSEYRVPVSDAVDAFGRGLFSYYGKSQGDPVFPLDEVDAYGLLNLYTGIRAADGMWEVSLFAKNVLDTEKVLTRQARATSTFQRLTFSNPPTVGGTFTSPYAIIGATAPREFGLNVRFAFGSR